MEIGLLKNQSRQFLIERADGEREGVHDISFSSTLPVMRYDWRNDETYDEVLSHDPADVDLSRLNAGGSVRDTHYGDQIGVIEKAYLKGEQGRAAIRFSKATARAKEIEADVADGIRQNVSVRYEVQDIVRTESPSPENGLQRKRVFFRWLPIHISFEPDPADPSVGVGRAAADDPGQVVLDDHQPEPPAPANDPPVRVIWII